MSNVFATVPVAAVSIGKAGAKNTTYLVARVTADRSANAVIEKDAVLQKSWAELSVLKFSAF